MSALLELEGAEAGYGPARVLFGVSLSLKEGEALTLMGRNGMGKTTTIRTIFGLLPLTAGRLRVKGADMTGAPPHRIAREGLGLVPEGRQIFPRLTVEENLVAAARPGQWDLKRVFTLFPRLAERRANMGGKLSGGEQQMLAIGRALMTNPRLLVLDEATEGLAPLIRRDIWAALGRLRSEGMGLLIVDKNLDALLPLADGHIVLDRGHVVWSGSSADLAADRSLALRHLDV